MLVVSKAIASAAVVFLLSCSPHEPASKVLSESVPAPSQPVAATDPAGIVDAYYRAIDARDFERAYRFWGPSGPPGQTLQQFRDGFAGTASVHLETGTPSRIEPAAGSRYIDVPVTITAETTSGAHQRFEGSYTLRRSVVDGASPADREWHLYRASLHEVR